VISWLAIVLRAMSGTREENIFMARLSEQAERYDDMIEYMKRVAGMGTELGLEERNLLSVAFKESLASRRGALRVMLSEEQRFPHAQEWIRDYRKTVEGELDQRCTEILATLDSDLIPQAAEGEAKVFFLKLKGDYHRYSAEFKTEETGRSYSANQANAAYGEALAQAESQLGAAHPIRLGLALNYSVFYHEVMRDTAMAVNLARLAYEKAAAEMPKLDEDQQQESQQLMPILMTNVELWKSLAQAEADGKAPELDGTAVEDL